MSKQSMYKDILEECRATYEGDIEQGKFGSFEVFWDEVEVDQGYNDEFKPAQMKPYYLKAFKVLGGSEMPLAKIGHKILCYHCGSDHDLYECVLKRKKVILCHRCSGGRG